MTTEIARRYPSHQGYATRADVPSFTDMTTFALACYMAERISAETLAEMMRDFDAYQDPSNWNALSPRSRALLMADVMGHGRYLTQVEASIRRHP